MLAVPGPCLINITSYYFNWCSGNCLPFCYGGSYGNKNRFHDRISCLKTCKSIWRGHFKLIPEKGKLSKEGQLQPADDTTRPKVVLPRFSSLGLSLKLSEHKWQQLLASVLKSRDKSNHVDVKILRRILSYLRIGNMSRTIDQNMAGDFT